MSFKKINKVSSYINKKHEVSEDEEDDNEEEEDEEENGKNKTKRL